MVIADKKPQPWLYTPVDSRRPSAVAMSSVWHGLAVESDFLLFADSDGDKFAALLATRGGG